jgi:GNAT superfamily N-acetyltransferase
VDVVELHADSPQALLDARHRLDVEGTTETLPGLDAPSAAESYAELVGSAAYERRGLAVTDGADLAGAIVWEAPLLEDLDTSWSWMTVSAAHRRRGVGAALLAAAGEHLRPRGRLRMHSSVLAGSPGAAFAARAGARVTQVELCNVLRVADLDDGLVRTTAARPAAGYTVRTWVGGCPDDLVDAYAAAHAAMDDVPHGDEPYDDWTWTAERVHDQEQRWHRLGFTILTAAAIHDATGDVGGYTQLLLTGRPSTAVQEDTGVVRVHRGDGLGPPLKCANLAALREVAPAIRSVLTWNAATNRHMLAVNEALGFRVHSTWNEVTLDV